MVATLEVEKRTQTGTAASRRIRQEGKLPAVVYGHGINETITVNRSELVRLVEKGERIFEMELNGKKQPCQLVELQFETPAEQVIHADFLALVVGEKITLEVPIELRGTPSGVKAGGVLNQSAHTIQVRCDPTNVPEKLRVDVSGMEVGDTLHASDIPMPEGVELAAELEDAIASVVAPVEEPDAESALPGAESSEPEVIGDSGESESDE